MVVSKMRLGFGLVLIGLISFVAADFGGYPMMGSYDYGMGLFGWIVGLLVIAVLVLLIVWLSKQIWKK